MTAVALGVLMTAAACGGGGDDQVAVQEDPATAAAKLASAGQQMAQSAGDGSEGEEPAEETTTTGPESRSESGRDSDGDGDTIVIDGAGDETGPTTTVPASPPADGPCGDTGAPAADEGGVSALQMRPADAPPECLGPTPEPELGTGDVQVTLRWESNADVDLHVIEPNGTEIWYGDRGPSDTGGQLDVDSNVGCEQEASVENVFWPTGSSPSGGYTVEVTGFQVDGCGSGDYTLTVKVQGEEVLNESGTVGEDETDTYEFEA